MVLIYQLKTLVFLASWGRQGKGILVCYEKHFLLILNFYCSQKISKCYQRKWTPYLSHLDIMDFYSLTGGVSRCISFQSNVESLKEKITRIHQLSCPCPPPALVTENVGAHEWLGKAWERWPAWLGPSWPCSWVSCSLFHSGTKGPIAVTLWTWSCQLPPPKLWGWLSCENVKNEIREKKKFWGQFSMSMQF